MKEHVDDALDATRAAIEEGVVPDGGVALIRASRRALENMGMSGCLEMRLLERTWSFWQPWSLCAK